MRSSEQGAGALVERVSAPHKSLPTVAPLGPEEAHRAIGANACAANALSNATDCETLCERRMTQRSSLCVLSGDSVQLAMLRLQIPHKPRSGKRSDVSSIATRYPPCE
jgi:hypothetical protein